MKIKRDFVTNSSSASFILTVRTKKNVSSEEFENMFGKFIENFKDGCHGYDTKIHFWEGVNFNKVSDGIFNVVDWKTMYNGYEDIPSYMKYLCLDSFLYKYHKKYGFEVDTLHIEK